MSTFRRNIKLGTIDPLIGTEDIADKAITTGKIADKAITKEKLAFTIASTADVDAVDKKVDAVGVIVRATSQKVSEMEDDVDGKVDKVQGKSLIQDKVSNNLSATNTDLYWTGSGDIWCGGYPLAKRKEVTAIQDVIDGAFTAEISGRTVTLHNVKLGDIINKTSFKLRWNINGSYVNGTLTCNSYGKLQFQGTTPFEFQSNPATFDTSTKYLSFALIAPAASTIGNAVDVTLGGVSIVKDTNLGLKNEIAQLKQGKVDKVEGKSLLDSEIVNNLIAGSDAEGGYIAVDTSLHVNGYVYDVDGNKLSNKADKSTVGELTDLTTTDKSSLVGAINEVKGAQNLVVFNVTKTDGVYSATIEGTLPSTEADIKKTRFIAYIREAGDNFVPLSASWTGSYYFAGLFIGYGKTKFTKIKIVASNIGVSSVDVTDLDF